MNNKSKREISFIFLFLICIVTRIATSIYYIEDIDSLRFALSIIDYDIAKLQPHFPGYPVFCFIAKILFLITNSLGITFSIIGGISVFIIIYYTLRLWCFELLLPQGIFCTALIFLNPLLWLMSNRYMPDVMGVAVTIAALYYLINNEKDNKNVFIGFFLAGLLTGVRLSYTPFLLLPMVYHFLNHKKKPYILLSFSIGCFLWFLPLIWITGIDNLYLAALKQTSGHFSEFGGTIITDANLFDRGINLIRSIWADGLGCYWVGRSWQTLLLSIPMLYFLYHGLHSMKISIMDKKYMIIVGSIIIYLIWIFFFQNVIYKSRHILPLIVFAIVVINTGVVAMVDKNKFIPNLVIGIFFLSLINITMVLVYQHKNPTSISKIKDDLINKQNINTVVSIPLINYFLKSHQVESEFLDVEDSVDIEEIKLLDRDTLLLIGSFNEKFSDNYNIISDTVYFHNIYVNRMWSEISIYQLVKK